MENILEAFASKIKRTIANSKLAASEKIIHETRKQENCVSLFNTEKPKKNRRITTVVTTFMGIWKDWLIPFTQNFQMSLGLPYKNACLSRFSNLLSNLVPLSFQFPLRATSTFPWPLKYSLTTANTTDETFCRVIWRDVSESTFSGLAVLYFLFILRGQTANHIIFDNIKS